MKKESNLITSIMVAFLWIPSFSAGASARLLTTFSKGSPLRVHQALPGHSLRSFAKIQDLHKKNLHKSSRGNDLFPNVKDIITKVNTSDEAVAKGMREVFKLFYKEEQAAQRAVEQAAAHAAAEAKKKLPVAARIFATTKELFSGVGKQAVSKYLAGLLCFYFGIKLTIESEVAKATAPLQKRIEELENPSKDNLKPETSVGSYFPWGLFKK